MGRKPIKPYISPYDDIVKYLNNTKSVMEWQRFDLLNRLGHEDPASTVSRKENVKYEFVSPRTVQRWVKRCNEVGLAGMRELDLRPGRKPIISKAVLKEKILPIIKYFNKPDGSRHADYKDLHRQVTEVLGIKITLPALIKFLQRECDWLKPKKPEPPRGPNGGELVVGSNGQIFEKSTSVWGFSKSPRSIWMRRQADDFVEPK
jgi:transposase